MGITGLLPLLKDAIDQVHLRQLEGYVVAVDTYCWIYRGAFSVAEQLGLNQPTDGHVKYVVKYIKMLLEYNIKPIMVFDGSCLPSKKATESKRRENKEMYKKKAAQCLLDGKRSEARECFQRCIEVTQKMAHEVIKAIRDLGVDVLVAPYEADAQLCYLSKTNIAHIIITEDSDLILFGCKKVLYKLDLNGAGSLLHQEKINSILQFDGGDRFERFRWMCILSGCDYLDNLPGIGLGKAKKLLKQTKKTEIELILKSMSQILKMSNLVVTQDYVENFKRAEKTFKYQIVFDPLKRQLVPLNDYGNDVSENENISYAGTFYDNDISLQMALGNLNVNDKTPVDDFDPDHWAYRPPCRYLKNTPSYMRSIWNMELYNPCEKQIFINKSDDGVLKDFNFINTKGLEKSINTNDLVKKGKLNDSISSSSSSPSLAKRKYETNENVKTPVQKKAKLADINSDIDTLLGEYAMNTSSVQELESSYFTSSNTLSPVLTKSSQKSSCNSQVSCDSNYISASSSSNISTLKEDEITLLNDSTSLDAKLSSSGFQGLQNTFGSPLIIKKFKISPSGKTTTALAPENISKFLDGFSRKPVFSKFQTEIKDENYETEIGSRIDNNNKSNESTNTPLKLNTDEKIVNRKVNQQNILNDIDNLSKKNTNIGGTKTSTSKTSTNSKKNSLNNNSNSKPISDYFIKFEYKKINENKFVNKN